VFVGIDWASRQHELCVVDGQGAVVERFGFARSERGIREALERLAKIAPPGELPVAIERPGGLLVSRLLEAGHPVVPIHPNAFHAARPRWEGAGSKSDPGDAYRLADLLRTDHRRLRPLRPLDQATRELQALVRLRDDHVAARVAATNQLHPGVVETLVRTQARLLRTLLASIDELDRAIAAKLSEHAKAQLLRPPPRVGTISLGQLVAEVGPLLDRTSNADETAALCGASPVTKRSGQQRAACFRHATNARARKALTLYADTSRHASPRSERIYREARARGCRHPHAVRILARAWLRVIWACWHADTPYDPAHRRARQRHLAATTLT
jgi:transposase